MVASGKYLRTARADFYRPVATTISGALPVFGGLPHRGIPLPVMRSLRRVVVVVQTAVRDAVGTFADGRHDRNASSGYFLLRIFAGQA